MSGLVTLLPSIAIAQTYDGSTSACRQEFSDSRITVTENAIKFYESMCEVKSAKKDQGGMYYLSMNCNGEGEEWELEARLQFLNDGKLFLETDGYARDYVQC